VSSSPTGVQFAAAQAAADPHGRSVRRYVFVTLELIVLGAVVREVVWDPTVRSTLIVGVVAVGLALMSMSLERPPRRQS
jgi:hypothetical protein